MGLTPFADPGKGAERAQIQRTAQSGGNVALSAKKRMLEVLHSGGERTEETFERLAAEAAAIVRCLAEFSAEIPAAAKGAVQGAVEGAKALGVEVEAAASSAATSAVKAAYEISSEVGTQVRNAVSGTISGIRVILGQPFQEKKAGEKK